MSKQTILISGGTSGIGAATALKFLRDGWQVSVFNNQPDLNKSFEAEIKKLGLQKKLLVMSADLTREKDLTKVVAQTVKKFKTIDVLFNNAGVGYFEEAAKVDLKKLEKMLEVNVVGMAALTKQVLKVMKKQKRGQIINMSSVSAKQVHAKSEFYASSKSAVLEYSEGLRQEQKNNGIKVATICPGMVATHFWNDREYNRRKKEVWHGKDPVRLAPEDIVRVVSFIVAQSAHADVQDLTIMPF